MSSASLPCLQRVITRPVIASAARPHANQFRRRRFSNEHRDGNGACCQPFQGIAKIRNRPHRARRETRHAKPMTRGLDSNQRVEPCGARALAARPLRESAFQSIWEVKKGSMTVQFLSIDNLSSNLSPAINPRLERMSHVYDPSAYPLNGTCSRGTDGGPVHFFMEAVSTYVARNPGKTHEPNHSRG